MVQNVNENSLLYNKYRPKTLKEIAGHTKVVHELLYRTQQNTIPRVILFSGQTGTGKTTLARIVAKNILCQNKDITGNSCNACVVCKSIDEEKINNFYFEENASNLTIDRVRDLIEQIEVKMLSVTNARVFVIDEVQEMKKTQAALNNMLKPIEKDYKHVYFIFNTMSEKDVPLAIKNRCVIYRLQPLSVEDITVYLFSICQKENIVIDTEEKSNVLITIAENSNGSVRMSLSLLERCIYSDLWTVELLQKELLIYSQNTLSQFMTKLFAGDELILQDLFYELDFLEQVRYILILLYKALHHYELTSQEQYTIKNIKFNRNLTNKQLLDIIIYALDELNRLYMYNYITHKMIEYVFIKIITYIKNMISQEQQTVNRRNIKT